jgi:hypothetical protein
VSGRCGRFGAEKLGRNLVEFCANGFQDIGKAIDNGIDERRSFDCRRARRQRGRKPKFPGRRRAASGEAGALFAVTFDASPGLSDCAKTAFKNALWLAEADSAEVVEVISIHTPFMQARAESGAEYQKPARKREEEEHLLRDFLATAPPCGVLVESRIVDTTTVLPRAILCNQSAPNCSSCLRPSTLKAPCHR